MSGVQVTRATPIGAVPLAESIHEDTTAKWFLLSSVAYFFVVGIIALTIAAKFVWPQLLGTVPYLSYGRLRPLHVNGMLFGWLLPADLGLAYYIVPRLCGVKLWSEKLGIATAALWNVIVLGAVYALPAGYNKGWEYAELPMPLVALVVVAWVMFGINIFATVATRKYQQMYVSLWYTMATILWTTFVYSTGNIAVLFTTGTNQANLNWMYVHNAVGLIFTPIGLAMAYYFIPKTSNTPLYSHKLSMIGFWSLAFVYVWTGAHHMLHGPISQWLQTIAIAFSVMLLIPVWTVVYNFFATMKGQWHQLRDNVPLKFLMSGVVFYLLTCFQGPMHSLRSVNAIVSKTDWIPGHAHMAVLGCFSFFAIAGCYYVIPRMVADVDHRGASHEAETVGGHPRAGKGKTQVVVDLFEDDLVAIDALRQTARDAIQAFVPLRERLPQRGPAIARDPKNGLAPGLVLTVVYAVVGVVRE